MSAQPTSPAVVFVAWTSRAGRAIEISSALGGSALNVFPKLLSDRRLILLRYLASSVITWIGLVRRKPQSVIVTNPPVFASLSVALYCAVARIPFAVDNHPVALGSKNNAFAQKMMPLTKWVTHRAAAALVTTEDYARQMRQWGSDGIVIHEAPTGAAHDAPTLNKRPKIAFAGIFGGDEPVAAVIEAARECPHFDVFVTGDPERASTGLLNNLPDNVILTGYLKRAHYENLLETANVVCALTTDSTSVMRAAYEAVYAERPLVISDTPALRQYFPSAVFVQNDASAIARGWNLAIDRYVELMMEAPEARIRQLERWENQRGILNEALGLLSSTS